MLAIRWAVPDLRYAHCLQQPVNPMSAILLSVLLGSGLLAGPNDGDGWIVLSDNLDAYQPPKGDWFVVGGARMDPKNEKRLAASPGQGVLINGKTGVTDNLVTRDEWGDVEVSLEFMIPRDSNSGVKLQGLYEIQIRDSSKAIELSGADCGGIYPRGELKPRYHHLDNGIPPLVNAAKAPGEWQSLEIVFRAPRFDNDGNKIANARFEKVVLNGKLIHDHVEVSHPTGYIWRQKEHAVGPLFFQADHGPVAFRNVRLRPLSAASTPPVSAQ